MCENYAIIDHVSRLSRNYDRVSHYRWKKLIDLRDTRPPASPNLENAFDDARSGNGTRSQLRTVARFQKSLNGIAREAK